MNLGPRPEDDCDCNVWPASWVLANSPLPSTLTLADIIWEVQLNNTSIVFELKMHQQRAYPTNCLLKRNALPDLNQEKQKPSNLHN